MPYPTILLVDQNPQTIATLVLQLNRWGCAVVVKGNLHQITPKFLQHIQPHLILINGYSQADFTDQNQAEDFAVRYAVPVLILSPEAEESMTTQENHGRIGEGDSVRVHRYGGDLNSTQLLGHIFLLSKPPVMDELESAFFPPIHVDLDEIPIGLLLATLQQEAFSGCAVVETDRGQGVLLLQGGEVREAFLGSMASDKALEQIQEHARGRVTLHQRILTRQQLSALLHPVRVKCQSAKNATDTNRGAPDGSSVEKEVFPDLQLSAEDIFLDSLYFLHWIFQSHLGEMQTRQTFRDKINEYAALYGDHFPLRYNEISQEKIQLFAPLPEPSYNLVVQLFQELAAELYAQAGVKAMEALTEKLQEIKPYLEAFQLWKPLIQRLNEIRDKSSAPVNGKVV